MKTLKVYFITGMLAVICLNSCKEPLKDSNGNLTPGIVNNPATASTDSMGKKKLPVFSFEETQFHFGEIKEGDVVTHEFKFKNTGNAPLLINSAVGSCGCTIGEYTKDPVHPGDGGKIKVTFNSAGKSGMVAKTITVLANTVPNTKVLTISAEIIHDKKK